MRESVGLPFSFRMLRVAWSPESTNVDACFPGMKDGMGKPVDDNLIIDSCSTEPIEINAITVADHPNARRQFGLTRAY